MQYIAILGRQPEIGLTELESIFGSDQLQPFGDQAALIAKEPNINDLGGTQKIGKIIYKGPALDLNEAPINLELLPVNKSKKTNIGLSYYGLKAAGRFVTATGLTLKKRLKARGSVRIIAPLSGTSLNAAQVKFNRLAIDGAELLIVLRGKEMVIALTTQFQDIDWYAVRDYERPTRSAKVGMLPPKLAQIMVNTTRANPVYDPFCGTGVILQESLLLNRPALGSDISPEMVEATENNLLWLKQTRNNIPEWHAALKDARKIKLQKFPIAIVTEGYLGPNLTSPPNLTSYDRLRLELGELYGDSLSNWAAQIPHDTEVTITAPVWRTEDGWRGLPIIDQLPDMGYTLRQFAHSNSKALIYRRSNQIVGRQLLILRKSNVKN